MEIEVTVPSLLSDCTGGRTRFTFEAGAATLDGALKRLFEDYPLLRIHLMDEQERIRRHVLIFHNQESISRLDRKAVPLQPGDRLQVLQNVSGG
jgi:molybdopterin synthase sulfur carrier subunit